ncbi:MAG: DNA mismatch repair endonuclease MutL [Flavobacteriales bacterium]|nr:DNA mismatch repair endonuclease MutL [Flavobacteriales bacterium]MBL6872764.1 DNA mismatch repair endonuclease MutL [Flavobacteriales bacterium]
MSDIIQLLPDHVANQIAAGEVIQRPSSAVKELLENAIDSGASDIKLIVKDAGRTLIQVIDNGCGMSETDARMCFERHATSKIREANDIHSIRTMGFRGEAMASMAAIAHVELKSKLHDNELGTKIIIEGSELISQENCTSNNGTSISIKNLFFNVPARRNFLKSDNVELRHIFDEFYRVSLANEDCSFSFYQNDKEVLNLPKSTLKQRIVGIFGAKYNEKLVPVSEETTLITISGFIGKPEFSKKTRGEQYFFVNNRFIKSPYLHHAVNNAFKDLISDGHHPSYFLFFDIDPKFIDVNIHPTKTEIKFEDEKSIYAIIRSCVKRALGIHNIVPTLDFDKDPAFSNIPKSNNKVRQPSLKVDSSYNPFEEKEQKERSYTPSPKVKTDNWEKLFEDLPVPENNSQQTETINTSWSEDSETTESAIFQLNNQYIVSSIKSGMMIIHQQRAHERILYEYYLNSQAVEGQSQQLLFPNTINLNPSDIELLKEISDELFNLGFRFDYLNKNSIVVLGSPVDIEMETLESVFEELIEQYKTQSSLEKRDNFALSMAKSMCIKKGRTLSKTEMNSIIDNLFACQTPNATTNSKPTLITLTFEEIAKKF